MIYFIDDTFFSYNAKKITVKVDIVFFSKKSFTDVEKRRYAIIFIEYDRQRKKKNKTISYRVGEDLISCKK